MDIPVHKDLRGALGEQPRRQARMASTVRLSCKGPQDDRGGSVSATCVDSDCLEDLAPLGAGCLSWQKGCITTMRCLPKAHTKALC